MVKYLIIFAVLAVLVGLFILLLSNAAGTLTF